MSTFIINIIAKSNLAEVLAKDDAALQVNTGLLAENSNALRANSLASASAGGRSRKRVQQIKEEATAFEKYTMRLGQTVSSLFSLKSAQGQVGYNIAGFSFRISSLFVPAMLLMATSMLPVIAAFLAMASAAVLAGGALVGFFALGALMQMRKQGRNGFQGYGGARRPYEQNQNGYARLSTIFEPVWKVLESPKLKSQMANATWFFKTTIGSFAEGLSQMLQSIDVGMLKTLEDTFLRWLPQGMKNFALWGNEMMKLVGSGTIKRLGDLVSWIAGGLKNAGKWLAEGGWEQIDTLTSLLSDLLSMLMGLGKGVLSILVATLSKIYPNPLKPVIEILSKFFNAIGSNPLIRDTIARMLQFIIIFVTYRAAIAAVAAIIGSTTTLILALVLLLAFLFNMFEPEIAAMVMVFLSLCQYLFAKLKELVIEVIQLIPGYGDYGEDQLKLYKGMNFENALKGDYAPPGVIDWYKGMEGENWQTRSREAQKQLDIFLHTDDGRKEKFAIDSIGEKTGTFRTPATNFRSRNTVRM